MKSLSTVFALSSFTAWVEGHYTSGHLLVNGTDTGLWKHVLKVAEAFPNSFPPGDNFGLIEPQYTRSAGDFHNPNLTCGRNAFDSLKTTSIADIVAGTEVGIRPLSVAEVNSGGWGGRFIHSGPGSIYLSRAPKDDLMNYHGDGEWFRIAYAGPKSNTEWSLRDQPEWNFTIPATTPPGKYLLRFEHFFPMSVRNSSQWFPNCALVNIMGPGGGTPGPTVKIPDFYNPDDIGFWIPFNQEEDRLPDHEMKLLEYKYPGPPVWKG